VIEYGLEILEQVEGKIPGKATLARLEATLDLQYADQFENKVFQYRWAFAPSGRKGSNQRAMGNRFPSPWTRHPSRLIFWTSTGV
jgi:hypothetical protein